MDKNATVVVLTEMLEIQNSLNCATIGGEWKSLDKDWPLAAAQECAEAIDHLGWKWWAKSEPNIDAAQLEVVDILHFALSHAISNTGWDTLEALGTELAYRVEVAPMNYYYNNQSYDLQHTSPQTIFRLLACMGYNNVTDVGLTCYLGERLGLPFNMLSALYRAKAILNLFRQHRGYASGQYSKMWGDRQDNDVIQQDIMPGFDWLQPDASNIFYNQLQLHYTKHTGR